MKAANQKSILIKSAVSFGKHLFISIFILLILAPIAQAQMGYVTTYSDAAGYGGQLDNSWSWIDPDNPDHLDYLDNFPTGTLNTALSSVEIYGMGYTDDSYNSYSHTYWVTTTIYGPGGIVASSTGLPSSVSTLITEGSALGGYYVNSEHYYECPYSPGSTFMAGVTSASFSVYSYKLQNVVNRGPFQLPRSGRYLYWCGFTACAYMGASCQPWGYDVVKIQPDVLPSCPPGITVNTVAVVGRFWTSCYDTYYFNATPCGP